MSEGSNNVLLEVTDLKKFFPIWRGLFRRIVGYVRAVDGVSFRVQRGEILALVGESGCGKTTTGRCIMRAIEPSSGSLLFRLHENGNGNEEVDMLKLDKGQLKDIRKYMGMIFQDPYSSLNPRMTILETVGEPFITHRIVTNRRELEDRVAQLLRDVRLDPEYMRRYPHAFSGGQRQRIAIARALALNPKFIVADEPVSALDVSVQAQILKLLQELREKFHLTYLFVAHNLAVVEYVCERVAVMYVGKMAELGNTEDIFFNPLHPYTEALLSAIPKAEPEHRHEKRRIVLKGDVADPAHPPGGCYFHTRCRYTEDICRSKEPPLVNYAKEGENPHYSACHFVEKLTLGGIRKGIKPRKYTVDNSLIDG